MVGSEELERMGRRNMRGRRGGGEELGDMESLG
jgi:hypothetical protein